VDPSRCSAAVLRIGSHHQHARRRSFRHTLRGCACAPPGGWYLCASTRRTSPKTDLKAHRPSLAASSAAPVGDSSHTHLPPPFPHDEPYFALLA
ncbi:unnamed protein product, partial [Tilletia laevis]